MSGGSASQPKVCFVLTSEAMVHLLTGHGRQRVGGAEVQLLKLSHHLRERGWQVSFIVGDYGQPDGAQTQNGITLHRAHRPRGKESALRFALRSLPRVLAALRAAEADVYMHHGANWIAGPIAWYCRCVARRSVFYLASITDALCDQRSAFLRSPAERWLCRGGLRRSHVIIAQTVDQLRLLREHQDREAVVIPNIWEAPAREISKVDPPTAFWAATMIPLKRPQMYLDVASMVPEVRFVMAGATVAEHADGAKDIQDRAARLPNVTLLGYVPFHDVGRHYDEAWVLMNTSHTEGFPNTFLQAWASSTPVVATFDPDDVLGRHGIGFHCETTDELAQHVRALCADKKRRDEIGRRAWQYVKTHHDPSVVIPKFEQALRGESPG